MKKIFSLFAFALLTLWGVQTQAAQKLIDWGWTSAQSFPIIAAAATTATSVDVPMFTEDGIATTGSAIHCNVKVDGTSAYLLLDKVNKSPGEAKTLTGGPLTTTSAYFITPTLPSVDSIYIEVNPANNTNRPHAIYKSTDDGATWTWVLTTADTWVDEVRITTKEGFKVNIAEPVKLLITPNHTLGTARVMVFKVFGMENIAPPTDPAITVSPSSLLNLNTYAGAAVNADDRTVTVEGVNLTADLAISIHAGGSGKFSTSTAAITAADAMADAGAAIVLDVDVATVGTFTDTLLIESAEVSKKIPLKIVVESATQLEVSPTAIEGLLTSVNEVIAVSGRTVTLSGLNLTADLTLSIQAGGSGKFSVPTASQTITAAAANADGGAAVALDVNVAAEGTFMDTLLVASSNAEVAAIKVPLKVVVQPAGNKVHYVSDNSTSWKNLIDATSFKSGDTLEIARGLEFAASAINATTKSFVIRAAAGTGAAPKWNGGGAVTTADLSNGQFIVFEGVDFVNASPGGYLFDCRKSVTWSHVVLKNCSISGYQAVFRIDATQTVGEVIIDNCLITNIGFNRADYSIFGNGGKVTNFTIKNSTLYNCASGIWRLNTDNFLMENCTVLEVGSTAQPSAPGTGTQQPNVTFLCNGSASVVYTFRNNIFMDYFNKSNGAVVGSVAFFTRTAGTVNGFNNLHSGVTGADITWNNGTTSRIQDNADWEFASPAAGDFTITGTGATYLRSAGVGGACVGDPRSYPGYVPPVPKDLVWSGADNALWNVPANWTPNGLPEALGTATIASGIAQSSGGTMDTRLILATGGTLQLAATPDTITALELNGGTLLGANTLSGTIKTLAKSAISVPASSTLTLPVGIEGTDTLVKIGEGTLYLSAATNPYAGVWRVEAGSVKVDGQGVALGTEVKVDLCGGKLELDGELVFLPGYAYKNGVELPVGEYDATSAADMVVGSGKVRVTNSHIFKYISQTRVSWESKFNWYPVRAIANGDTALIEGTYLNAELSEKYYDVELTPATFPAGAKLFLNNTARARLNISAVPTAARSAFTADIETAKGIFYTNTTSKNLFGLDGTLTVKDTTYFMPDARVELDTVASGIVDNKISPISLGATLYGSAPIVQNVLQNPDNAGGTYGLQLVKANNTAYTGSWIIEKANLVGKAVACFGSDNTIYLSSGTKLYLDVADATDKSQSVVAAEGAKIQLNGDTRLTKLTLGATEYTTGEFTAASHPDYISGTGAIKLGVVEVTSVVISTPDSVQAAVVNATMQLSAVAYPVNADDREITWSIASGDATVNPATGLVTFGATASEVTIKAATDNGTAATITLPVYAAPKLITSISLDGPTTMEMGELVTYTATYEPADATDNKLKWEITSGDVDTFYNLSNNRFALISSSTNPLTVKVWAASAESVSKEKSTSIIRATTYTWVVNDAQSTGSDGLWNNKIYWNPQAMPQEGDTAIVAGNGTSTKFTLGTGGQDDENNRSLASFPTKLFLMNGAVCRLSIVDDKTNQQGNDDPFTNLWDFIEEKWYGNVDLYLKGGRIGTYTTSEKTFALGGTINVLDSSFIYMGAYGLKAATYVFSEIKGSAPLTLAGDDTRTSNDPNESRANWFYGQATVILRRANPDYTGKWYLDLLNLYTKEAGAFGKADIHVGTGRKLIVDHEQAIDSLATVSLAAGGKLSTRSATTLVINVAGLVLNGEVMPAGTYSRNSTSTTVRDYFENERIIIRVGNEEEVPAESISVTGPSAMLLSAGAQFSAVVMPNNANQIVEWSVEPASMGTITSAGYFTSAAENGCVTIVATATDGSNVRGTKKVSVGTGTCATAVDANELGALTMSPNPVQSDFTVVGEKNISSVKVYTLTGTLLQTVAVSGNSAIVSLSGYAAGSYVVVVSYEGTSKTLSKIIVKQ